MGKLFNFLETEFIHLCTDEIKIAIKIAITLLLKCPKSKTLATPNAYKAVEQQKPSFTTGGDAKWQSHFGTVW